MATFLGSVLKQFVPGSLAFLVLGIGGALLLLILRPAWKRLASSALALLVMFYVVLALPWTAYALTTPLAPSPQLMGPQDARGATTLVVLHGDYEEARIRETARLYQLLKPHLVVVLSRGWEMRDRIVALGVPENRTFWTGGSRTTREQISDLARLLQSQQIGRIVLVASPVHMARVTGLCRRAGIDMVPAVAFTPFRSAPHGLRSIIPDAGAFLLSYNAMYEHMALGYYRYRGWL